MMAGIFAAMLLALVLSHFRLPKIAVACAGVAFALAVYLFQWEIRSPDYGFRMPWIQTDWRGAPLAPKAA